MRKVFTGFTSSSLRKVGDFTLSWFYSRWTSTSMLTVRHLLLSLIGLLSRTLWCLPLCRDLLTQTEGQILHPRPKPWSLWVYQMRGSTDGSRAPNQCEAITQSTREALTRVLYVLKWDSFWSLVRAKIFIAISITSQYTFLQELLGWKSQVLRPIVAYTHKIMSGVYRTVSFLLPALWNLSIDSEEDMICALFEFYTDKLSRHRLCALLASFLYANPVRGKPLYKHNLSHWIVEAISGSWQHLGHCLEGCLWRIFVLLPVGQRLFDFTDWMSRQRRWLSCCSPQGF